jgi:hypothetical protein
MLFSMIQLTMEGFDCTAGTDDLECQFEGKNVFCIPQLIHPDLIRMISSRLDRSEWTTRDDGKIAREAVPSDPSPVSLLNFALNTPELLDFMRRVTHCGQISGFSGRVYRMAADAGHFDSWHADVGTTHQDRLVGMSINLGPRRYAGGIFRLREEATGTVLCELPNTGQGDAIFFRISPGLKHMVTAIEGAEPKTAFAGWFRSGETNFYKDLQQAALPNPPPLQL